MASLHLKLRSWVKHFLKKTLKKVGYLQRRKKFALKYLFWGAYTEVIQHFLESHLCCKLKIIIKQRLIKKVLKIKLFLYSCGTIQHLWQPVPHWSANQQPLSGDDHCSNTRSVRQGTATRNLISLWYAFEESPILFTRLRFPTHQIENYCWIWTYQWQCWRTD